MLTLFRSLCAVAVLAASLAAQPGPMADVAVTGVVEPLPGAVVCPVGVTHRLSCSEVFLLSHSVDLDLLVGQNVRLLGIQQGGPATCIAIDVLGVQSPPPASLETCGTPALGCPVRFKVCPPGLAQYWLFLGLAPGFHPLTLTKGTWLIDGPFLLFSQGFLDIGCAQLDVVIPNDPNLIGLPVQMQAARRDVGPVGVPRLTNAVCFELLPPLVPCQLPNC